MNEKALIVMQTDFGLDSGLVSCMHGICKLVDRELEVADSSHLLPAFDVKAASFCLQYTVPCWPAGTVFISVVDPGVGTSRKAAVAKLANGSYVVTPDNGALTYLHRHLGVVEIREIDESRNRYQENLDVAVFHGRDLFAYCGAKLAAGIISFEEVGPAYPVAEMITHPIHLAEVEAGLVKTKITGFDPFGSAELSVSNKAFASAGFIHGEEVEVTITRGDETAFAGEIPYEKSFGYVAIGENLIFNDLGGYVSIGCNQCGFKTVNKLREEDEYLVIIKKIHA